MFDKDEIKKKSLEFKLDVADVERDYIQSWIIKEINTDTYLSSQLTLKGSGALRKLYYPETRFARDLDFSAHSHLDKDVLKKKLRDVGISVQKQTGIAFIEEVDVRDKKLPDDMKIDALEARMYFKAVYSDGKINLKTQVDVTQGERLHLPPQYRNIIHPYSDFELFKECKVRCQKLEEIIATKFITLIHRQKPGDLFDLVNSTFITKNNDFINRGQVIRALISKTDFANSIEQTKRIFMNLPIQTRYAQTWDGLLVPVQSAMTLGDACKTFSSSIDGFFNEMAQYVGNILRGGPLFSETFRERIVNMGRKKQLVKVTYSGLERLVEPYKLEYYTREKDGRTNEYFWGYDKSGGTSGTLSIKRFTCASIQNIEETEITFFPQWDIEL